MSNTLDLCDANAITKVFDRGCNFSYTEGSVYAVMTPWLGTIQVMARNTQSILTNSNQLQTNLGNSNNTSNQSNLGGNQVSTQYANEGIALILYSGSQVRS